MRLIEKRCRSQFHAIPIDTGQVGKFGWAKLKRTAIEHHHPTLLVETP